MVCRCTLLMHAAAGAASAAAAAACASAFFMVIDQTADQYSHHNYKYSSNQNVSHYATVTSLVSLVASLYGRGTALQPVVSGGKHDTKNHEDVTDIDSVAVYNEERNEVTVFAVNRTDYAVDFEADVRSFEGYKVREYLALEGCDLKAVNSADGEAVAPVTRTDYQMDKGIFQTQTKPYSWNVIRFGL